MTAAALAQGAGARGGLLPWVRLEAAVLGVMATAGVLHAVALAGGAPATADARPGAMGNALAAFILVETLFIPVESWLGARHRRSRLIALGAGLFALGALAGAGSPARASWWAVAGAGAGLFSGGTVAPALQRVAARPLCCIGATAAACAAAVALGALALLARAPQLLLAALVVGMAQAAVILVMALFVIDPPRAADPPGGGP